MTARDAWGQVAHNLRILADSIDEAIEPAGAPAVSDARPADRAVGASPPAPAAHSVNTNECPKHHVPWEQGNYGPYCKQMTDDPAWGKSKTDRDGNPVLWCKLTPKNAPDWVRVHGLPA